MSPQISSSENAEFNEPTVNPPSLALQLGQVLQQGEYRIIQPLGRGGMGAVYLATQSLAGTDRQVVVKEMTQYYNTNDPQDVQEATDQFKHEAETLVSLNHPNIPQIFDYFLENDRYYIVMQYIEGESLDQLLSKNNPDQFETSKSIVSSVAVVQWGVQLCSALRYLAENDIVHNDIKPANLVLDRHGVVWIVDFGTARSDRHIEYRSTRYQSFGTSGYIPPEQYAGRSEPKSDVYALAASLYHLLTHDDPSGRDFRFPKLAEIDPELRYALESALEPDVKQRVPADVFQEALEQYLSLAGVSPSIRGSSKRKTPSYAVGLLKTAGVIILVLIAVLMVGVEMRNTLGSDIPTGPVSIATISASPESRSSISPTVAVDTTATVVPSSTLLAFQGLTKVTPSATTTPTRLPTSTPLSGVVPDQSVSTLPPGSPVPRPSDVLQVRVSAPILIEPADGALLRMPIEQVVLRWEPQSLLAGSCYFVTIQVHDVTDTVIRSQCVTESSMIIPKNLAARAIGKRIEWYVIIGRPTIEGSSLGNDTEELSPPSVIRSFIWMGPDTLAPSVMPSPTIIP